MLNKVDALQQQADELTLVNLGAQVWHWASVWSMDIPWQRKLLGTWRTMAKQLTSLALPPVKMTHFTKERFQSQAAFSGAEKAVEYVANLKAVSFSGMAWDSIRVRQQFAKEASER